MVSLSLNLCYEPLPGFLSLLTCVYVCARACSVMRMVLPIHVPTTYLSVVVARAPAGLWDTVVCFLPLYHPHTPTHGHEGISVNVRSTFFSNISFIYSGLCTRLHACTRVFGTSLSSRRPASAVTSTPPTTTHTFPLSHPCENLRPGSA